MIIFDIKFFLKDQSKDAELMLKFKITVVLFCQTIEEVQFPTVQLSDLLKEIRFYFYFTHFQLIFLLFSL
jgi:hypothetical protein